MFDTKVILKSVLKEEFGFKGKNRLSHVSLFEIKNYHKLLLMSDGAMNMYPGVDEKQEIIENAVKVLPSFRYPKSKSWCDCGYRKT